MELNVRSFPINVTHANKQGDAQSVRYQILPLELIGHSASFCQTEEYVAVKQASKSSNDFCNWVGLFKTLSYKKQKAFLKRAIKLNMPADQFDLLFQCPLRSGHLVFDYYGDLAQVAAIKGRLDVLKVIMDHTRPSDVRYVASCAFGRATSNRKLEVVKYLLEEVRYSDLQHVQESLLRDCIRLGFEEVASYLQLFLDSHGISRDTYRDRALNQACLGGHKKTARYWLDLGADLNNQNDQPVLNAIKSGDLELIYYLVREGARIDRDVDSAFYNAINAKRSAVVHYLLEEGFQPKRKHFNRACNANVNHADIIDMIGQALGFGAAYRSFRYLIKC